MPKNESRFTIFFDPPFWVGLYYRQEADSLSQIRRTIVEKLTPQEIQLLKRITMEGAAYKTVASEMNISIGSCQKKIQRVRKKLRKYVDYH